SELFWYAFGPVFYRGRLDGSARVLCIASDPGPTECLPFVRRCLVGDAGQRTQGFLAKIGLDHSYVLVNAFAVALHPSHAAQGETILKNNATLKAWRHQFYDQLLADNKLQAIVSFGSESHTAYDVWSASNPAVAAIPSIKIPHPSALDRGGPTPNLVKEWHDAVTQLGGFVTKDVAAKPNYGAHVTHDDYASIPRGALIADAPAYCGNGLASHPVHFNCGDRPSPDDGHSLWLKPPPHVDRKLRYFYKNGRLDHTQDENGHKVTTNPNGIPV